MCSPAAAAPPPDARGGWRRGWGRAGGVARRLLCSVEVLWTFFYFLMLVCVAVPSTTITQVKVSEALLESWRTLHSNRIATTNRLLDIGTDRVHDMASGFLALHTFGNFSIESPETLSTLCSVLVNYNSGSPFRMFSVVSLMRTEMTSCLRGSATDADADALVGFLSHDMNATATYYINASTYTFEQPPRLDFVINVTTSNLTSVLWDTIGISPVFALANAYYRREIDYVDPRVSWMVRANQPHLFYYNYPAGLLFRGKTLPTHVHPTDCSQVRVDGSKFMRVADDAYTTGLLAAVFVNVSLSDGDPLIMSNNWGQVSMTSEALFWGTLPTPTRYLRTSAVQEPLMRSALSRLNLAGLQRSGYEHSVVFEFNGAPAIATAMTVTTERGLTLPVVYVSPQASVTGPYTRHMRTIREVVAGAVILFTLLFWVFVRLYLAQPLRHVTRLLRRNVQRGARTLYGVGRRQMGMLAEVRAVVRAYNTTMVRLREIDAFVPEAVRGQLLPRQQTTTDATTLGDEVAAQPSRERAAPARSAAAPQGLAAHLSTAVYLSIRAAQRTTAASEPPSAGAEQARGRSQRLAAVADRTAQEANTANSGPFATPASLAAFVVAVQELCRTHRGTVHRLCPDACVLHFNSAVRAHLSLPDGAAATAELYAAHDAHDATDFAFALASWVDARADTSGATAAMPDVRALLDTSVFTCGHYRPAGSEQTLQVALGRDVQRELGRVPQRIGVRVAMTEETAVLLRGAADAEVETEPDVVADGGGRRRAAAVCDAGDAVRQLPVDVLRTGRAGLDECTVVLYEALPGRVAGDAAWQCYARCCVDGFAHMLRGDYAGALAAYRGVADIADLEPGLLPASMRREAAASAVTGGAASVQVARLMEKCEYCVTVKVTESLCRATASELGVDEVLGKDTGNAVMEEPKAMVAQERRGRDPVGVVASHSRQRASSPACASRTRRRKRPRYPAVKERCVVVLRDGPSEFRCVVPLQPAWIDDNLGQRWSVTRYDGELSPAALWSSNLLALGSSGALATVNYVILRDVAPAVAKAIESAPAGPMSAAMRSTAPVCGPTAAQVEDVRRAMKALRELQHPNLLPLLGYSHSLEGGVVLLWEFSPGGTLRQVLHRYALVKAQTMLRFAFQIVSALAYMHECGGTYGVLQLGNVMVSADGVCRLTGYSADRAAVGRLYRLHRSCYLSPAMAAGAPPTPACDMFCFGLLFVEAATLKPAWRWASGGEAGQSSGTAEELADLMKSGGSAFGDAVVDGRVVAHRELVEAAVVAARYPPLIRDTVRACLSPDPAARPSAVVVRAVLKRVLSSAGVALEEDTSDSLEMRVESLE